MDNLISRQAAIDALLELDATQRVSWKDAVIDMIDGLPSAQPEEYTIEMQEADIDEAMKRLRDARVTILPSTQPEPLTDKEQRIFLAAMSREEKVCEEVDRNHVREPYEDSLMSVCREIKRKVKGTLWTRSADRR